MSRQRRTKKIDDHSAPSLIPIRAEGLSLPEIEAAILQVLAGGRQACVDEGCIRIALPSNLKRGDVARWADIFSHRYQFNWEHRALFEDLLFSVAAI